MIITRIFVSKFYKIFVILKVSLFYLLFEYIRYPSLRVAYIDEREDPNGKSPKVYYSVLVKGGDKLDEVTTIII